jgi:hypothetical protein
MTTNKPHNFYKLSIVLCATVEKGFKAFGWRTCKAGIIDTIPVKNRWDTIWLPYLTALFNKNYLFAL